MDAIEEYAGRVLAVTFIDGKTLVGKLTVSRLGALRLATLEGSRYFRASRVTEFQEYDTSQLLSGKG